jgi:hypothetical protein
MGFDIFLVEGKEKLEDSVKKVYHACYETTSAFAEESPAFRELMSFADRKGYPCEVTPEEFTPLIPKFEQEKEQLEKEGKTKRGNDLGWNKITIYDCVEGCYEGLKRAERLGVNLKLI